MRAFSDSISSLSEEISSSNAESSFLGGLLVARFGYGISPGLVGFPGVTNELIRVPEDTNYEGLSLERYCDRSFFGVLDF